MDMTASDAQAWAEALGTSASSSATSSGWQDILACTLQIPRPAISQTLSRSSSSGGRRNSINSADDSAILAGETQLHPLAVLLFLLDGLSILKALTSGGQGGLFVQGELDPTEMLDVFLSYLSEVYLGLYGPAENSNDSIPFLLNSFAIQSIGNLAKLSPSDNAAQDSRDAVLAKAQYELRQACIEALEWLQAYRLDADESHAILSSYDDSHVLPTSPSLSLLDLAMLRAGSIDEATSASTRIPEKARSETASACIIDAFLSIAVAATTGLSSDHRSGFTPSVDLSLQATISKALRDRREGKPAKDHNANGSAPRKSNVGVNRWILASLLRHYLGSGFGQYTVEGRTAYASKIVRYAAQDADDIAIRSYFARRRGKDAASISGQQTPAFYLHENGISRHEGHAHIYSQTESTATVPFPSSSTSTYFTESDGHDTPSGFHTNSATTAIDAMGSATPTNLSPTSPDLTAKAERDAARRGEKLRWLLGEPMPSMPLRRNATTQASGTSFRPTTYSNPQAASSSLLTRRDVADGVQLLSLAPSSIEKTPGPSSDISPHRRAFSAGSMGSLTSASPHRATFGLASPSYLRTFNVSTTAMPLSRDINASDARRHSKNDSGDVSIISPFLQDSSGPYSGTSFTSRADSLDTYDSHTRLLHASTSTLASSGNRDNANRRTYHGTYSGMNINSVSTTRLSTTLEDVDVHLPEQRTTVFGDLVPTPPLLTASMTQPIPPAKTRRRSSTDVLITYGRQSDTTSNVSAALPPTTNELTTQEKQSLVRKNRKLRAVLGAANLDKDDEKLFEQSLTVRAKEGQSASRSALPISDAKEEMEFMSAGSSPVMSPRVPWRFTDDPTSSGLSRESSAAAPRMGYYSDSMTSPDLALLGGKSPVLAGAWTNGQLSPGTSGRLRSNTDPTAERRGSLKIDLNEWPPSSSESESGEFSPFTVSKRDRLSAEALARAARRRKLLKVQSFLGEKVPASMIYNTATAAPLSPTRRHIIANTPRSPTKSALRRRATARVLSSASSKINKLARTKSALLSGVSSRSAATDESGPSPASSGLPERIFADTAPVQVDPAAVRSQQIAQYRRRTVHAPASPRSFFGKYADDASENRGAHGTFSENEPAIAAIRRARKLEKMFGSLPPSQLYARKPAASHQPIIQKMQARDDRLLYQDTYGSKEKTKPPHRDPLRRMTSNNTINTVRTMKSQTSSLYRQSLASVRYVAQSQDPQVFDDFKRLVLADTDGETSGDDERVPTPRRRLSRQHASLSSAVRQRQKLVETASADESEGKSANGDVSGTDEDDDDEEDAAEAIVQRAEVINRSRTPTLQLSPSGNFAEAWHNTTLERGSLDEPVMSARASLVPLKTGESPTKASILASFANYSMSGNRDGNMTASSGESQLLPISSEVEDAALRRASTTTLRPLDALQRPRGSMESVRLNVRRAHKLARVFGTTKSEVLNSILDVIEADIAELDEHGRKRQSKSNGNEDDDDYNEDDDEFYDAMDEEERRELLDGVAALRAEL